MQHSTAPSVPPGRAFASQPSSPTSQSGHDGDGPTPRERRLVAAIHRLSWALLLARTSPSSPLETGPLVVDLRKRTATLQGTRLSPSPREWALLAALARRPGCVVRYDLLAVAIWGAQVADARRDRHRLRVLAWRLRDRLGPAAGLVVTTPAVGMMLDEVAPGGA